MDENPTYKLPHLVMASAHKILEHKHQKFFYETDKLDSRHILKSK